MIRRLRAWFSAPAADAAGADFVSGPAEDLAVLRERLSSLEADPYLSVADTDLNLISVFDDLKYDRSDADVMSIAMRRYAFKKLNDLGFRQTSGTVLTHGQFDCRVVVPKFHALGASPFDITRYTPKRTQDYYLLTPTQTACRFVDLYPHADAVERVKTLISKHPINIYRMMDSRDPRAAHREFLNAIGHLKNVQRQAIKDDPLCRRRALG